MRPDMLHDEYLNTATICFSLVNVGVSLYDDAIFWIGYTVIFM